MNNKVDEQYILLLQDILKNGTWKNTRSGKVLSVFDRTMQFDLTNGFPVLTTKKIFLKGIIYELLWFLSGNTNIKYLIDHNVHIWDDDAYRYYLQKTKNILNKPLSKEEFINAVINKNTEIFSNFHYGDLGEIYGKQWRRFGISNFDQIAYIINTLKTNPNNRRMILTGWNPDVLTEIALPACHTFAFFYTQQLSDNDIKKISQLNNIKNTPKYKLSCSFTCRSQDIFLGTPFNITSYALLTHMIAQCANMLADKLIWHGMDCHIYEQHINSVHQQIARDPHKYELPALFLNPLKTDIDDFTYDDIIISNYNSYPSIKAQLSVGL